jgi:hypothetical protein
VSAAGNECLLWERPSDLQKGMQEVIQPAKILDIESSNHVQTIKAHQVMPGAFLVTAISDKGQYIFMAKVKAGKSKVKKADSVISLAEKNHEIIYSEILGDQSVKTVYGNMF